MKREASDLRDVTERGFDAVAAPTDLRIVASVRETGGHPVEEAERPVDFAQQQRSGVGRDRSAVERGGEHIE